MVGFLRKLFNLGNGTQNKYKRVVKISVMTGERERALIKHSRDVLSFHQVPLEKIRFVFTPSFTYDIDKNTVNPEYEMMLPLRNDGSGLFNTNEPVIYLNKPENSIMINVVKYRVDDVYDFVKQMVKNTKRGVVIDINIPLSMNSSTVRLVNLDDEVKKYNKQHEEIIEIN
jgi:hypothetical protein